MGLGYFTKGLFFITAFFLILVFPGAIFASTITSIDLADWHSFSDICSTNPPAESQLLSNVNVTVYGTDTGDFDYIYYYINYQNGDSTPPNAVLIDYGAGGKWWKYPVASSFYLNNGYNSLSVKGLVSSTRTFQVNLYDSVWRITRSYQRVSHLLDRTAPNYSGSFSSPNWSGSPKLRTITNGSYNLGGAVGDLVTLEPYPYRSDSGGFGFDRVDLWVAWKAGDNPPFVTCPPSPPYEPWNAGGSCNPVSCASFTVGSGKAWYIGSVYGTNGGTVAWNTTGFVPGTRTIVANAFDNPGNRMGQNFLTYTGNGADPNFARLDYNLVAPTPTPEPTSTPTPTPSPTPSASPSASPSPSPSPSASPSASPSPTPSPTPTPRYYASGLIFLDTNKNGKKDLGELNYTGSFTVTSSAGTVDYTMPGNYTIINLTPGTFTISLKVPIGYAATYPPKPLFGNPKYQATLPCTASSLNPPSKNINPPCYNSEQIIGADFGIVKGFSFGW